MKELTDIVQAIPQMQTLGSFALGFLAGGLLGEKYYAFGASVAAATIIGGGIGKVSSPVVTVDAVAAFIGSYCGSKVRSFFDRAYNALK